MSEARAGHRFGGPWTEEKLGVLRGYLAAYVQALKNQSFQLLYLDAFAGTGERTTQHEMSGGLFDLLDLPELSTMTKGSARVALEVSPPFDGYVFVEKRRRHSGALETLKAEYPTRNITVREEDANDAIQAICHETVWKNRRAVLFLDPYGMQVDWATMQAAAATKAVDVWVLFPTGMGLNRLITNDGHIPEEWQRTLDRFLGCQDWRAAFYSEVKAPDLFGETMTAVVKQGGTEAFEAFFLNRLRSIFPGVLERGFPLRNTKGQVMYLLCFACGNPSPKAVGLALKLARAVLKNRPR